MTRSPVDLRRLVERADPVFSIHPQIARYFAAATIEDARQRLTRSIDRGDGPGLVVGGAGTGKSLLLQVLAAQFHERFDIALLACAHICTRRALLQAILFELGLPYRVRDEGELRLSLLDHLLSVEKCPGGLLLLVDESQSLSAGLLDELRVMTNLIRGGVPRVRLVLAGSSTLEESFANPELESFSQRLSARCYLAPLNRDETAQFIRAQIGAAGGAPDELFTTDAHTAVFDATDGVPRLINQLCDRVLSLADSQQRQPIERKLVQAAWADLQQLPTPWENPITQPVVHSDATKVVEFGGLPDYHELDEPAEENDATDLETFDDVAIITAADSKATRAFDQTATTAAVQPATDPFAEQFAEEEVVFDCFADWDEMFQRDTPRVENRRDPGFATLVQAALDATAPFEPSSDARDWNNSDDLPTAPISEFAHPELFSFDDSAVDDGLEDVASDSDDGDSPVLEWPPLRLAVLSGPAPLKPIPLISSTLPHGLATFGTLLLEADHQGDDWPNPQRFATAAATFLDDIGSPVSRRAAPVEDPILVIEEDAPTASLNEAQVRHEEYRHLFSRLRSV